MNRTIFKYNRLTVYILLALACVLTLLLLVAGCKPYSTNKVHKPINNVNYNTFEAVEGKGISKYNIDVELNTDEKILTGMEKVTYVNTDDVKLKELFFHLYPNAYRTKETVPALFGFNETFPKGFSPGYIDILSVQLDNNPAAYEIQGSDKTILKIPLRRELLPSKSVVIIINFKIKVPEGKDRLSWYNTTYNFGNWYPIAAVYDKKGWHLDPYYGIGDPFYSQVGNYSVRIIVPKTYTVAASGTCIGERVEQEKKQYSFFGRVMRDFAFIAGDEFTKTEALVDGIQVQCYSSKNEKHNDLQLKYAVNAIKIYNKFFGKYPYQTFSVVDTYFTTGMEYPGIVFISNNETYKENGFYERIISHETAHQWWYGVIGNDEVSEAWLDESLATFSEDIYNNEVYHKTVNYRQEDIALNQRFEEVYNEPILQPVNHFPSLQEYSLLVYHKGAVMLGNLKELIGEKTFLEALRNYYLENQFKNVSTVDFVNNMEKVTGRRLKTYFDKWLYGKALSY